MVFILCWKPWTSIHKWWFHKRMILSVAHSSTAFLAQPDSRYQHDNYVCIIDIIYNHVYYMIYIYYYILYIIYIHRERESRESRERRRYHTQVACDISDWTAHFKRYRWCFRWQLRSNSSAVSEPPGLLQSAATLVFGNIHNTYGQKFD